MPKIASFDIDAQKCFTPLCPAELPVAEGHLIADELNQNAQLADYRLGSKDAHPANAIWVANEERPALTPLAAEHADLHWPKHAVPGTLGFELIDGLPHPTQYDFFVWKGIEPDMHPYGACYHDLAETKSTGLIEFLHYHKIDTIIAGGLATDYCVKVSVVQLLKAGFTVLLNESACRGISQDTITEGLEHMQQAGAKVFSCANDIKDYLCQSLPHS